MKVITIVLEEKDGDIHFNLFNEKDVSGLSTENEQRFADEIEEGFKVISESFHLMEEALKGKENS